MYHFGNPKEAPHVLLFTADAAYRVPAPYYYTGCSRPGSADVTRCIVFVDVLLFSEGWHAVVFADVLLFSEDSHAENAQIWTTFLLSKTLNRSSTWKKRLWISSADVGANHKSPAQTRQYLAESTFRAGCAGPRAASTWGMRFRRALNPAST